MKLRIQNYTAYRTLDLRRFFLAGLRAMGTTQPKTIEVRYRSGRLTCSRATVGTLEELKTVDADGLAAKKWRLTEGRWIRMLIDRAPALGHDGNGDPVELMQQLGGEPMRRFARVFEHEVLHNKGVEHREMTPSQMNCDQPLPKWADGLVVRVKEPKIKPDTELLPGHRKAIETLLEWEKAR